MKFNTIGMMKVLRIQCPKCGVILSLKDMPGLISKMLKCPRCFTVNKVADYYVPQEILRNITEEGQTKYERDLQQDGKTLYCKQIKNDDKPGVLYDMVTGQRYPLLEGHNIVGRQSFSLTANIQILTTDRHISRQHLYIDVGKTKTGHYYLISNAKDLVKTFVNGQQIGYTDQIQITDGDIIQIGEVKLKLETL